MSPFQNPDDKWSWGPNAVKDAKRTHADEEIIEELQQAWVRTKGFFSYPTVVSLAALARGWPLSVRALLRNLITSLAVIAPLWRNDKDAVIFIDGPYWAKRYWGAAPDGRIEGTFYPALGRSKSAWKLDTWLLAAGYAATATAISAADRLRFVRDVEFLGKELGLRWLLPDHGVGKRALDDLKSMAKNPARSANARLTPLLPVDFLDRLKKLSGPGSRHTGKPRRSYWNGERIDRAMRKRGLNQAELAAAVGVSAPLISQVIAGRKGVSAKLSLSFDEVLHRPGSMSRDNRVK